MLARFLLDGVIGPLRTGLSKSEILTLAGPPSVWKGKPESIYHGKITDYNESNYWYCNGVHIEIKDGVIAELGLWIVHPLTDWSHEWFRGWPLSPEPKLSEIRSYLDDWHIPYAITAASGGFGFDIVMFESYVLGVARRDAKLEDVDVHGIVRVKDCEAVPKFDIPVCIEELNPRRDGNQCN